MGFKTTNYNIKELDITIPTAYAKINDLFVDKNGNAYAKFAIQQTREDVESKQPVSVESVNCVIDKTAPLYEQLYLAAKEKMFADWEDDIVD